MFLVVYAGLHSWASHPEYLRRINMAKTKKQKQKTIECKGTKYVCVLRNAKVAVRVKRTARGQIMLAGTLNLVDGTWQNANNRSAPLPSHIKNEVERIFSY